MTNSSSLFSWQPSAARPSWKQWSSGCQSGEDRSYGQCWLQGCNEGFENPDDKFSQFEAPGSTERGFKTARVHGTRFQGTAGSSNAVSKQGEFKEHGFKATRVQITRFQVNTVSSNAVSRQRGLEQRHVFRISPSFLWTHSVSQYLFNPKTNGLN